MTLDEEMHSIVAEQIRQGRFSGSYKLKQISKRPHISGSINTHGFNHRRK